MTLATRLRAPAKQGFTLMPLTASRRLASGGALARLGS